MIQPPAIRVRHLSHRFGAREVLRDVSFDVQHGEIFGFIGPNGAGKTTTIRVMATLLEPATGRVEIDGLDVSLDPDKVRRLIGYMPDHAGVYERITVREFLEFFADAYQVLDANVVDVVLELTDLKKLDGRLLPFGWLTALRERKRIDAVRVFALGVKPEYQHTGIAARFYVRHIETAAEVGVSGGEEGWILEVNEPMNRAMEGMGGTIVKRYRLYEKTI